MRNGGSTRQGTWPAAARWQHRFSGRIDQQVSARISHRIGEIEAVLANTRRAGCGRGSQQGRRQYILVGYVVPRAGRGLKLSELCKHLRKKLPDYMVPSAFVRLKRLPLTPSGKVDRLALPPPDRTRPTWKPVMPLAHTELEEQLAAIWADFLGMERVGIHDNFFDFGGHSLLATQMVAASRNRSAQSCRRWPCFDGRRSNNLPLDCMIPGIAVGRRFLKSSQRQQAAVVLPAFDYRTGRVFAEPGKAPWAGPTGFGRWLSRPATAAAASLRNIGRPRVWCVERIGEARAVGPYSLAGYSFSGMLAYEVARQLRSIGRRGAARRHSGRGRRGRRTAARLLRYPWLVLENFPFWIAEVVLRTSLRENVARQLGR